MRVGLAIRAGQLTKTAAVREWQRATNDALDRYWEASGAVDYDNSRIPEAEQERILAEVGPLLADCPLDWPSNGRP